MTCFLPRDTDLRYIMYKKCISKGMNLNTLDRESEFSKCTSTGIEPQTARLTAAIQFEAIV
jgi:hypothetical protein